MALKGLTEYIKDDRGPFGDLTDAITGLLPHIMDYQIEKERIKEQRIYDAKIYNQRIKDEKEIIQIRHENNQEIQNTNDWVIYNNQLLEWGRELYDDIETKMEANQTKYEEIAGADANLSPLNQTTALTNILVAESDDTLTESSNDLIALNNLTAELQTRNMEYAERLITLNNLHSEIALRPEFYKQYNDEAITKRFGPVLDENGQETGEWNVPSFSGEDFALLFNELKDVNNPDSFVNKYGYVADNGTVDIPEWLGTYMDMLSRPSIQKIADLNSTLMKTKTEELALSSKDWSDKILETQYISEADPNVTWYEGVDKALKNLENLQLSFSIQPGWANLKANALHASKRDEIFSTAAYYENWLSNPEQKDRLILDAISDGWLVEGSTAENVDVQDLRTYLKVKSHSEMTMVSPLAMLVGPVAIQDVFMSKNFQDGRFSSLLRDGMEIYDNIIAWDMAPQNETDANGIQLNKKANQYKFKMAQALGMSKYVTQEMFLNAITGQVLSDNPKTGYHEQKYVSSYIGLVDQQLNNFGKDIANWLGEDASFTDNSFTQTLDNIKIAEDKFIELTSEAGPTSALFQHSDRISSEYKKDNAIISKVAACTSGGGIWIENLQVCNESDAAKIDRNPDYVPNDNINQIEKNLIKDLNNHIDNNTSMSPYPEQDSVTGMYDIANIEPNHFNYNAGHPIYSDDAALSIASNYNVQVSEDGIMNLPDYHSGEFHYGRYDAVSIPEGGIDIAYTQNGNIAWRHPSGEWQVIFPYDSKTHSKDRVNAAYMGVNHDPTKLGVDDHGEYTGRYNYQTKFVGDLLIHDFDTNVSEHAIDHPGDKVNNFGYHHAKHGFIRGAWVRGTGPSHFNNLQYFNLIPQVVNVGDQEYNSFEAKYLRLSGPNSNQPGRGNTLFNQGE